MSAQHPFLSDEEILEIVKPLTQPAAIMRWFKHNGFPDVKARPNGMPLISRAYFDAVTAAGAVRLPQAKEVDAGSQPDLQGYLAHCANRAKLKVVR